MITQARGWWAVYDYSDAETAEAEEERRQKYQFINVHFRKSIAIAVVVWVYDEAEGRVVGMVALDEGGLVSAERKLSAPYSHHEFHSYWKTQDVRQALNEETLRYA